MRAHRFLLCCAIMWSFQAVGRNLQAQEPPSTGQLPPTLPGLSYVSTIGDNESFGFITAATSIDQSRFAVLDGYNSRVSLYSAEGMLLSTFGRKGRGPKEFFYPVALVGRDSDVLVLDRGNLRLSVLGTAGDSLHLLNEVRVPVSSPEDMCFVAGRLYLLGLREGHLIHELDESGQIVQSFGVPLPNDFTGGDLSAVGLLACSSHSQMVAFAASLLNRVQVFSTEGEMIWDGEIPGYERQQYDTTGGRFRPKPPSAGFIHVVKGLDWVGNGQLLVQLGKLPEGESPMLEARLLDVGQGWLPESPRWPRMLHVSDSLTLFEEIAPYPLVKVYRGR